MSMLIYLLLPEILSLLFAVSVRGESMAIIPTLLLISAAKLLYAIKSRRKKLACAALSFIGLLYEIGQVIALDANRYLKEGTPLISTPTQSFLYAAAAIIVMRLTSKTISVWENGIAESKGDLLLVEKLKRLCRRLLLWIHKKRAGSTFYIGLAVLTVLLGAAWLVFAPTINGSKNWLLLLGVSVQLSEIYKLLNIIEFSLMLQKSRARPHFMHWYFGYTVVQCVILMILSEFGTAILLLLLALALLILYLPMMKPENFRSFCATAFLPLSGSALLAAVYLLSKPLLRWVCFSNEAITATGFEYRCTTDSTILRIVVQLNERLNGVCDQLIYGRQAFANAGFFLPFNAKFTPWHSATSHLVTDCTFFCAASYLGRFVACLIVFCWIGLLIFLSLKSQTPPDEHFLSVLAVSAGVQLLIQTIYILISAFGWLPFSGMTLPFLSVGGSSLLISACVFSVLLHTASKE